MRLRCAPRRLNITSLESPRRLSFVEFGADSRVCRRSPDFLKESGEDGVVVLILMSNPRPDCAGPDWTVVPWKKSSPSMWIRNYGMSSTDSRWGRFRDSVAAARRCCDLVCGGVWRPGPWKTCRRRTGIARSEHIQIPSRRRRKSTATYFSNCGFVCSSYWPVVLLRRFPLNQMDRLPAFLPFLFW